MANISVSNDEILTFEILVLRRKKMMTFFSPVWSNATSGLKKISFQKVNNLLLLKLGKWLADQMV